MAGLKISFHAQNNPTLGFRLALQNPKNSVKYSNIRRLVWPYEAIGAIIDQGGVFSPMEVIEYAVRYKSAKIL